MTQVYLITGFLGAGKTTFLKNFVRLFPNKRLYLIVNEFGREGVDGALLRELGAALAEIDNGSIFCSCRLGRFEEELTRALEGGPDLLLVEASGLSDPTNVRRVLARFPEIVYRGSICLADAVRIRSVFSTARMCPRQLAVSSLVLLNKTDLATPEQCAEAEALIRQANPAAHIKRTRMGRIEAGWLDFLTPDVDVEEALSAPDLTLQKATIVFSEATPRAALEHCLAQLAESAYRMKGFLRLAEGTFFADCTGPLIALEPWRGETNNRLVLLAGKGMPLRETVKSVARWYGEYVTELGL